MHFGPGPLNHAKFYSKYCPWLYLLVGLVSHLNDLWFKGSIQKYILLCKLILIITSHLLKLIEWFKIQGIEYLINRRWLLHEIKKKSVTWKGAEPHKCDIRLVSRITWCKRITPPLKELEMITFDNHRQFSNMIYPYKYTHFPT